jgi:hypothetical protein
LRILTGARPSGRFVVICRKRFDFFPPSLKATFKRHKMPRSFL